MFRYLARHVDNLWTNLFPPHHLVHYPHVALDDLHHLGRDILVHIVGHGDAVVAVAAEADGGVDGLKEAVGVDAGDDEAALVDGFRTLRRRADAHGGEGMAHRGEETALLGKGAAVADYSEGIHLEAVVVVEAERFVLDDALIQLKAAGSKAVARAGVARVEDGHVVLLRHPVDGGEEREEVLLRVDVLLSVGGEQDIPALLQAETAVDVARLDFGKVVVEYLGHGRAGHVSALLGQPAVGQITPRVLGVGHVHVADDVHDAAVRFLRKALVLAAVAGLHVEDGDVQTLCSYHTQA